MHYQIHPNKIRQALLLLVIGLLGFLLARELAFALGSFLTALTLYVLFRKLFYQLVFRLKWKKWLAALSIILLSFVLIFLPLTWLINVGVNKIGPLIKNPTILYDAFEKMHQYLITNYQLNVLNKGYIDQLSSKAFPVVQKMLGGTFATVGTLFLAFFILFFMLVQSTQMELWLKRYIPFKSKNANSILTETKNLVYSNAIGIPIVAIMQGIVATIGYFIFGAPEVALMGALTAICSVIPLVGTMLIYVPLGLYQMATNHTGQGIGILLWGLIVVGSIDNIARFLLQKRMANIHPLITIFGVIIGVNVLGFLGIIFGPILISLFTMMVKIYLNEFGVADADADEKLAQSSD
jgi:predicted PurR-regulated permease PerM